MTKFNGFEYPEENWSKLPHQVIESMHKMRPQSFMVLIYVLRHTWGFQDDQKRISLDEFSNGRKVKGGRFDGGTGMPKSTVAKHIRILVDDGFLFEHIDDSDGGRIKRTYSLSYLEGVHSIDPRSKMGTQDLPSDTRTKKDTFKKETLERDSAPLQKTPRLTEAQNPFSEFLIKWELYFPDKPQPRNYYNSKLKGKWRARIKDEYFSKNWEQALKTVKDSSECKSESWFHAEFFLRNEENWEKCLNNWMAWKDKKGNGKTAVTQYKVEETEEDY